MDHSLLPAEAPGPLRRARRQRMVGQPQITPMEAAKECGRVTLLRQKDRLGTVN